MKLLRIFRAQGDCGCTGSGQVVSTTPYVPPAGSAVICDNAYLSLVKSSLGRMLIVPGGANCQNFLKAATENGRGFVFMGADGQVYVEPAPSLRLPIINPMAGVAFQLPGGFPFIIIGTGVDPNSWRFVAAPTAGTFSLISENGMFLLRDVAQSSGETAVCGTDNAVEKVKLYGCIQTGLDGEGAPIFALRKLIASHQRVIVGDIDGTGDPGFRTLGNLETLNHPAAAFNDLKAGKYRQISAGDGSVEGDGMPDAVLTGVGAIADGKLIMWSPTTQKFYKLPARTKESVTVNADVAVADNGAYVGMGGHGVFANVNFNHPDFFVSSTIRMSNDAANYADIDYGLFVDGVLVHSWDVKGSKDNTLSFLFEGIAVGSHTVEIKYSSSQLFTVL